MRQEIDLWLCLRLLLLRCWSYGWPVNLQANLGPLGTAANKGSCAIFARYYDVSMAVIAVHFAADSKGSSQEVKRHTVGGRQAGRQGWMPCACGAQAATSDTC